MVATTTTNTILTGIEILVTEHKHCHYAKLIVAEIAASTKIRGTGIAKRSSGYLQDKIKSSKAVIAIDTLTKSIAGFCYIESWQDKEFVVNSGLIVFPGYRKL